MFFASVVWPAWCSLGFTNYHVFGV